MDFTETFGVAAVCVANHFCTDNLAEPAEKFNQVLIGKQESVREERLAIFREGRKEGGKGGEEQI